MEKRWILVYDNYTDLSKKAVNTLSAMVSGYLKYVLPVKHVSALVEEDYKNNIITIGQNKTNSIITKAIELDLIDKVENEQGYAICVGKNPYCEDALLIAIAGADEYGVLYGAIDFCNKYCNLGVYTAWKDTFTLTYKTDQDGRLYSMECSFPAILKDLYPRIYPINPQKPLLIYGYNQPTLPSYIKFLFQTNRGFEYVHGEGAKLVELHVGSIVIQKCHPDLKFNLKKLYPGVTIINLD